MNYMMNTRYSSGRTVSLGMKAAVAVGAARRFMVGDPNAYAIDTLAGATLDSLAQAEHHAERGEVVLTSTTIASVGDQVRLVAWRHDDETDERFGVVEGMESQISGSPWEPLVHLPSILHLLVRSSLTLFYMESLDWFYLKNKWAKDT